MREQEGDATYAKRGIGLMVSPRLYRSRASSTSWSQRPWLYLWPSHEHCLTVRASYLHTRDALVLEPLHSLNTVSCSLRPTGCIIPCCSNMSTCWYPHRRALHLSVDGAAGIHQSRARSVAAAEAGGADNIRRVERV